MDNMMRYSQTLLLVVFTIQLSDSKFLWFEEAPNEKDSCTEMVYGLQDHFFTVRHPDPRCVDGGLLWYATWGRVHLHFFLDEHKQQDFKICLTGGESNAVIVWYNFRDKHWEPLSFPNWQGETTESDMCRYSHNGTLDLFVESPWKYPVYASFIRWHIQPFPLGHAPPYQRKYGSEGMAGSRLDEDQVDEDAAVINDEEDEGGLFSGIF